MVGSPFEHSSPSEKKEERGEFPTSFMWTLLDVVVFFLFVDFRDVKFL